MVVIGWSYTRKTASLGRLHLWLARAMALARDSRSELENAWQGWAGARWMLLKRYGDDLGFRSMACMALFT